MMYIYGSDCREKAVIILVLLSRVKPIGSKLECRSKFMQIYSSSSLLDGFFLNRHS